MFFKLKDENRRGYFNAIFEWQKGRDEDLYKSKEKQIKQNIDYLLISHQSFIDFLFNKLSEKSQNNINVKPTLKKEYDKLNVLIKEIDEKDQNEDPVNYSKLKKIISNTHDDVILKIIHKILSDAYNFALPTFEEYSKDFMLRSYIFKSGENMYQMFKNNYDLIKKNMQEYREPIRRYMNSLKLSDYDKNDIINSLTKILEHCNDYLNNKDNNKETEDHKNNLIVINNIKKHLTRMKKLDDFKFLFTDEINSLNDKLQNYEI